MTSREQFEQVYAEYAMITVEQVQRQRASDGSYAIWNMDKAWYWWQRAKEAV